MLEFYTGIKALNQAHPQAPKQKIICSAKRPTRVATSLQDVFQTILMSKQFVCSSVLPLGHSVPPQFDVSFPEKLLKIVAVKRRDF